MVGAIRYSLNLSGMPIIHKYEHKSQPLASKPVFYKRIFRNLRIAMLVLLISLLMGVGGYHFLANQSWIDSLHNASMILSGMGPVMEHPTEIPIAGKWFSSLYALFSGIVFIATIGFVLTPAIHRFFHKLHLQEK
jgi:Co/Zn/Cd efflux system component